ncbi:hypothetical protein GCM10010112_24850 [Actinoplanes lobatus]|uniref:Uncharacterized protein n=1 Tax=Actinoplanes lobatus TaxID=113568 RepID=A0A7W7HJ75_9ACTN|nr:hypothetical protein [Actinoplanes lobatus]MBB4751527.1 hypothetical protein [Actinoplanes lobatus]GGN64525.1 hypothetical protein GCM10010112_24850 [Actinoplanes lobatus]GIE41136.1 hypothetical protein Alo02nite_40340 [Actinoplanes lobatus]
MNPLFTGLFDDAAIFPPGNLPMADAVRAHRERAESGWAPLLGPFICSLARWDELVAATAGGPTLRVSLVVPDLGADLPEHPSVEIVAVEGPAASAYGGTLTAYQEIGCDEITATRVAALRDAGLRLKIRTGGVRADAFPSEARLAGALWAAVRGGLAFKLTAGLHDPLRHRDPATGFAHHGYLNVILATARALQGYDIERALADQDGERVAAAVAGIDEVLVKAVRHHFVSFGTCSISEPVDGLLRFGLLEDPR